MAHGAIFCEACDMIHHLLLFRIMVLVYTIMAFSSGIGLIGDVRKLVGVFAVYEACEVMRISQKLY